MAEKGESEKYTPKCVDVSDDSLSDDSLSGDSFDDCISSSSSEDLDLEPGIHFYVSDFVEKFLKEKRQQQKIIFQPSSSTKDTVKALLTYSLSHLKRSLPPSNEVPSKVTSLHPSPPYAYPSNPSQTSTCGSSAITSDLVAALLSNISPLISSSKSPSITRSSPSSSSDPNKPRRCLANKFPRVPTYPWPDSNVKAQSSPQKTKRLVPEKATPSTSRFQEPPAQRQEPPAQRQEPPAQRMITQSPPEMHVFLFELSNEYEVSLGTVYEAIRLEKLYCRGKLTGLYSEKPVPEVGVKKSALEKILEEPVEEEGEVQASTQPVEKEGTPIKECTNTSRKGGPYKNKRTS